MPQVASKLKKLPRMSDGIQKRVGRVFCVTGYTPGSDLDPATQTCIAQSDTESNSSGYLSSSSFESSGEEKRLGLNEHKVFQVWEKWSQQRDQPRNSTPKNAEECRTSRLQLSTETPKRTLSLKKNLGEAKVKAETEVEAVSEKDSFWDIVTPQLFKSRSENDMRGENGVRHVDCKRDLFNQQRVQQLPRHDAGSVPNMTSSSSRSRGNVTSSSSDWKRKPFHTMSTSDQDLRLTGSVSASAVSRSSKDTVPSGYQSLPRYRVVVNDSKSSARSSSSLSSTSSASSSNELVNKLSKTCADFADSGTPVDESMTEFLANVDQDNLASLLNFYDKVTSSAAYEKARRNPKNYEAVLF